MKAVDFEWEGKVEAEILDALANLLGRRSAIIRFNNSVDRIHGNGSHRQTSVSDGLSFPLPSSNSHHGSCVFTSSADNALRPSVTVQVPTATHGTSLPACGSAEYSDAIGGNAGSAIEAHNTGYAADAETRKCAVDPKSGCDRRSEMHDDDGDDDDGDDGDDGDDEDDDDGG
jgi:cobalamin biosynthesis protein CobT